MRNIRRTRRDADDFQSPTTNEFDPIGFAPNERFVGPHQIPRRNCPVV